MLLAWHKRRRETRAPGRSFRTRYDFETAMGVALLCAAITPCRAQEAPGQPPIVKPPPIPTGIVPLPQGPPPTSQQAPLPNPAGPSPGGERPLRISPGIEALAATLRGQPITMQDAVAIGLSTNRNFALAVSALLHSQGRESEARAALNPTFGLGANITEFDAPTQADFGALTGGASRIFTLTAQFYPVLTASVNLPLDIAGTLRSAVSQAQFEEVAARIDVNRARNQIVLDVKNAFYNALRAQAQASVANDNLNNTISRLNVAQKNYAAGISPRFDVITATTDVANAQQQLIQAKSQVSLSLAQLKNAIGLNIRTPLSITDRGAVETPPGVAPPAEAAPTGPAQRPSDANLPAVPPDTQTPAPAPAAPIDPSQAAPRDPTGKPLTQSSFSPSQVDDPIDLGPDFDAALREAQRTRPEILEGDAQVTAAQKGVQYARRSSLPSLSVSLGYTYTPNAAVGFARVNQGAATLSVSVPVFDGGLSRARVEQARADIGTAETNRRNAVDQVGLEVQQAYLTLLQARDRVAVANVGLTQAREAARLARVRYEAGVAQTPGVSPILELSNAQNSLAQAESNQVNALYDYNSARAALDKAIGRYSYADQGPGYTVPPSPEVTGATRPPSATQKR